VPRRNTQRQTIRAAVLRKPASPLKIEQLKLEAPLRRLGLARELGATHVIDNSDTVDLARRIAAISGDGVDYLFESTGDVQLIG
jgi:Zn-dependent alcohol dehydrogenase